MPITNTLGFNADAINTKGEDILALRIVNSDGSQSGSETWFDAVLRSKSTIMIEQPEEDILGESKRVLNTEAGAFKGEIKFTSLQSNSELFNFLNSDVQSRYFACFIDSGEDKNGTERFFYAPLCKIQRGFSFSQPGGETEITIKVLDNPSAFTGASLSGGSVTAWTNYVGSLSASISGAAHDCIVSRSA